MQVTQAEVDAYVEALDAEIINSRRARVDALFVFHRREMGKENARMRWKRQVWGVLLVAAVAGAIWGLL